MKLCIDEKDEERESEAQSVVRAKKRAGGGGGEGGLGGRALHSHLNCRVSLCLGSLFEYQV